MNLCGWDHKNQSWYEQEENDKYRLICIDFHLGVPFLAKVTRSWIRCPANCPSPVRSEYRHWGLSVIAS